MHIILALHSLVIWLVNASITPYIWIDFDTIHNEKSWTNDNSVRAQSAADGSVFMLNFAATSLGTDINGNTVGVFSCDSDGLNTAIAYLPSTTYSAFALEAVIQIPSVNILYHNHIIGIDDTLDNTAGNGIGYNEANTSSANNLNIFYPTNIQQNGWYSNTDFLINGSPPTMNVDEWYHVIISQDSSGLVRVYVNGNAYGASYTAPGGAKSRATTNPSLYICGDYGEIDGFDGDIRAFGFYTNSFDTSSDAYDNCFIANLTYCGTFEPTSSPSNSPITSTTNPSINPTIEPTINTLYSSTSNPSNSFTSVPINNSIVAPPFEISTGYPTTNPSNFSTPKTLQTSYTNYPSTSPSTDPSTFSTPDFTINPSIDLNRSSLTNKPSSTPSEYPTVDSIQETTHPYTDSTSNPSAFPTISFPSNSPSYEPSSLLFGYTNRPTNFTREYNNYTITIVTDDLTQKEILKIIMEKFNLTEKDIIPISTDDGSYVIIISLPSIVSLTADIIQSDIIEAVVDEYGQDIDISVEVTQEETEKGDTDSKAMSGLSWYILMAGLFGLCCCAVSIIICLIKSGRMNKNLKDGVWKTGNSTISSTTSTRSQRVPTESDAVELHIKHNSNVSMPELPSSDDEDEEEEELFGDVTTNGREVADNRIRMNSEGVRANVLVTAGNKSITEIKANTGEQQQSEKELTPYI